MAPGDQRPRLLVTVTDEHGRTVSGGLGRWLATAAPRRAHGAVNVALVSDARVRALNLQYRRKDSATDVLSFPGSQPPNTRKPSWASRKESAASSAIGGFLGEIVIARGVARRQARQAGHGERTEWRVLALHGLLHLLGYDHEADDGEMARLERRLRRRAGLREGLIDRRTATRGAHAR